MIHANITKQESTLINEQMKNIFFDLDGTLINLNEEIIKGCKYA